MKLSFELSKDDHMKDYAKIIISVHYSSYIYIENLSISTNNIIT
jgi:hypothetical protein